MVKPENFGHLHLVHHFTGPLKAIIGPSVLGSYYGLESCLSKIAMYTEQFLKVVRDLKVGRSEIAM